MYFQDWGAGDVVVALHPLALESTAFAGVGRLLEARGLRTLAADLPGFGRTPAPAGPLTPTALAAPVIDLARQLVEDGERPPLVMGMSMGGRVALEAALVAPDLFRGVVLVAPYLPWQRHRWALPYARLMSPRAAERLPLERIWPLLKAMADVLESRPGLENDWMARASVRVTYYWSCAATRASFVSAARELALDPAFGPAGTWTRMRGLLPPAAFMWCGRDALIPSDHAGHVAQTLPTARQLHLACSGHFVHGSHFRCFNHAIAQAVAVVDEAAARPAGSRSERIEPIDCACLAETPEQPSPAPGSEELAGS